MNNSRILDVIEEHFTIQRQTVYDIFVIKMLRSTQNSLSYIQFHSCVNYKNVTPLKLERYHCIRKWFRHIFKKWFLKCGIPLYLSD